jgi:hypothetical protein
MCMSSLHGLSAKGAGRQVFMPWGLSRIDPGNWPGTMPGKSIRGIGLDRSAGFARIGPGDCPEFPVETMAPAAAHVDAVVVAAVALGAAMTAVRLRAVSPLRPAPRSPLGSSVKYHVVGKKQEGNNTGDNK